MKINPLNTADFYKTGHYNMMPDKITTIYSNGTHRSTKLANMLPDYDNKVVSFGLQGYIKSTLIENWNEGFFNKPKAEVIAKYKRRMDTSLGPDAVDMKHIEELHDLGYLPIVIKALPEGSRVNVKVPMFTIKNTHSSFAWLTNYLETSISVNTWKSCANATTAYEYRRLFDRYADLTGSPKDFVMWQGHDFSMRGMSTTGDAHQTSAGHILSFAGTDTILAIDFLEEYYNANADKELIAGSVPATEHSLATANTLLIQKKLVDGGEHLGYKLSDFDNQEQFKSADGKLDSRLVAETLYLKGLLKKYPTGVISNVSDSFDYWAVLTKSLSFLKADILNRAPNAIGLAKLVCRPDSGDPVKIICGDANALVGTPEYKGSIEVLWDIFGGTITSTGHKVLNQRVGLIYGDSITLDRAVQILEGLHKKGFASCNVVLGIGSFTYQHMTRDTFGFAMKATYAEIDGKELELYKDPKTDNGTKKSAKGLLRVEKEGDNFVLYDEQTVDQEQQGELTTVFEDGKLVKEQSLSEIRKRLGTF